MKLSNELRKKIKNDMLLHLRNIDAESRVNLQLYNKVINRGEKLRILKMDIEIPKDTMQGARLWL